MPKQPKAYLVPDNILEMLRDPDYDILSERSMSMMQEWAKATEPVQDRPMGEMVAEGITTPEMVEEG